MSDDPSAWWRQALFDLLCNERIKLVIEGEDGEIDGALSVQTLGRWEEVASFSNGESVDEVMTELLKAEERDFAPGRFRVKPAR